MPRRLHSPARSSPHRSTASRLTNDITGLEVAAAMKNAYAIALGIADGRDSGPGCHTTISARPFFRGPLPKWESWPARLEAMPKRCPGWQGPETCR